jgi:hypothetical protein
MSKIDTRRLETLRLEEEAIMAVKKFGLRVDADMYKVKLLVDTFYQQQLQIEEALRELEREDQE